MKLTTRPRRVIRQLALLAGLAIAASTSQAGVVSWLMQGTITTAVGPDLPGGVDPNDSFSFVLNFDPSTPVSNPAACLTGGIGTRCFHAGSTSLSFTNIVIDGIGFGSFTANPANDTNVIVRNNFNQVNEGIVDGYSFTANDTYADNQQVTHVTAMSAIFRGPEDLGLVTDGRLLPSTPPANLLALTNHLWQVCDTVAVSCDRFLLQGSITSIAAVPEPGTWALAALGLAVMVGSTRRRRA